jgi:hypothetical protein
MDTLFNTSQKFILIKDMTSVLDFDLINNEFSKLTWKDNIANKISNEMNFFDKPEFDKSKTLINEVCKNYIDRSLNLQPYYEDLRMTYSWGNITDPGHSHHDHVHPFSVVSGVIYLDDNPTNANLYVEAFMPDIPYFITKNKSYVALKQLLFDNNIDPNSVNNLKNHMVLFLSNCAHFVEQTTTDAPARRSLSFNTFWKGLTGVRHESLGSLVF